MVISFSGFTSAWCPTVLKNSFANKLLPRRDDPSTSKWCPTKASGGIQVPSHTSFLFMSAPLSPGVEDAAESLEVVVLGRKEVVVLAVEEPVHLRLRPGRRERRRKPVEFV